MGRNLNLVIMNETVYDIKTILYWDKTNFDSGSFRSNIGYCL